MAKKQDIPQKLITAAFELAALREWRTLSMDDIATHAHVALPDAIRIFKDKDALIHDVMNRADNAALAESLNFEPSDTVKDKLFALLMARFDYLAPYKNGISPILRSSGQNPIRTLGRLSHVMQSMKLMLEAAGIETNSPFSIIKINGLALIAGNTMRVWLGDNSDDLGPTMATLDNALARVDKLASTIFCASHNNS